MIFMILLTILIGHFICGGIVTYIAFKNEFKDDEYLNAEDVKMTIFVFLFGYISLACMVHDVFNNHQFKNPFYKKPKDENNN